jgi:hypothetical protein
MDMRQHNFEGEFGRPILERQIHVVQCIERRTLLSCSGSRVSIYPDHSVKRGQLLKLPNNRRHFSSREPITLLSFPLVWRRVLKS